MNAPPLILVIGGAASGKSAFAERLAHRIGAQAGLKKLYLATAQACDDEMAEKIARHRAARANDGWTTIEITAPLDIAPALARGSSDHIILLDGITLWVSNVILSGMDWDGALGTLINALTHTAAPVIVVSDEVGTGVVPDNTLARTFRTAQGGVNQRLAEQADVVVFVTAGLPMMLKGGHLLHNMGGGG